MNVKPTMNRSTHAIAKIVCRCCGSWLENGQWRHGNPPSNGKPCICPKCQKRKRKPQFHQY